MLHAARQLTGAAPPVPTIAAARVALVALVALEAREVTVVELLGWDPEWRVTSTAARRTCSTATSRIPRSPWP